MPSTRSFRPADMILRSLQPELPGSKLTMSAGFPILFFRQCRILWRQRGGMPGRFVVYTGHRDTRDEEETSFKTKAALLNHFSTVDNATLCTPAAPTCPYCASVSILVDRAVLYGPNQVGKVYLCSNYPTCDACVGANPVTLEPYGTLANAQLRKLRGDAHFLFDPLWKGQGGIRRTIAYQVAAKVLDVEIFHIGCLTPSQCEALIQKIDTIRQIIVENVGFKGKLPSPPPARTGQSFHLF